MVAKIRTVAFRGIDVLDIDVEVQIANGLPAFNIVECIKLLIQPIIFLACFLIFTLNAGHSNSAEYCLSKTIILGNSELNYHYSQDSSDTTSAIDRAGWRWMDKADFDGDYDFLSNPQSNKITNFPELYSEPCSTKQEFLSQCQRAGSSFSKATGVAFIDGHKSNFLGISQAESYAVFGKNIVKIPSSGQIAARYRGDIPSKKMAAIWGSKGELLIFNGTEFRTFNLEKAIPRKDGYPSWAIENDPVTNRDFVVSNGLLGGKTFAYEIMDGPNFKELTLDERLEGPFVIFTIKDDKQSWIIERDGIYVERGDGFYRVAHRSSDAFITAPALIGIAKSGDVYFQLETNSRNKFQPYLLKHKDGSCDIPLDLSKDIELHFANEDSR